MTKRPVRLCVFASGLGSLFDTLRNHAKEKKLTKIAVLVSNNRKSGALEKARDAGIPDVWIPTKSGNDFEKQLEVVKKYKVGMVILAGYLRPLRREFIEGFRGPILNIHPAVLPKYGGKGMYGKKVHEAVIRSGDKESGATVHLVNEFYDEGKIVLQKKLDIPPGKDAKWLEESVRKLEHPLLIEAIEEMIEE